MIGMVILGAAAVLGISLGWQGLVNGSVQWSKNRYITGIWARVIGLPCLVFGLYIAWLIFVLFTMVPR